VTERPRLAILFDAVEEGWPSMDYVAEMLVKHLQEEHAGIFETRAIKPRFFGGFERLRKGRATFTADRAVTRFLTYPTSLAVQRRRFELFHIADHSYAQLAHVLPAERTGIYCHDLDAFAAAAHAREGAGWWRRGLARLLMAGLERAAVIFHSTAQIRKQLEAFGALDPRKLVHAPYGVHPDFFTSSASEPPPGLLPSRPYLLHVGSGLPRKRLDVLFRVYAAVRERHPDLVLVQQGAVLESDQRALAEKLGILPALVQPPTLARPSLAALYRNAEMVLVTSDREGFGLPVVEALAADAAVVASDIAPLREIGGDAVTFCPPGDVEAWVVTVSRLLEQPSERPSLAMRRGVAQRYSWSEHAKTISQAYSQLLFA
jgi:glycosyltransferase involved in cell wall biosynthesis